MKNRLTSVPLLVLMHMLVLAVSVAGSLPALVGLFGNSPVAVAKSSVKTCCCGGNGECCGKACCGTSAPKPDPSPTPAKPQQDRVGPLHLAVMQAITLLHGTSSGGRGGFDASHAVGGSGLTSLQAQQIRLQV